MIKLLIVDDSALMRRVLGDIFQQEDGFEVFFARDGVEALAQLHAVRPDVITLDMQMPRMGGLACLDRIMVERPCPVVMVSSMTVEGAEATLQALELGAVDFMAKPGGAVSLAIDELASLLVETVRRASTARVRGAHRLSERIASRRTERPMAGSRGVWQPALTGEFPGLVVIGTSTGGPPALEAVLSELPVDFPWPVAVAQHMPAPFTGSLARRLDGLCAIRVMEVTAATPLAAGTVYIARGGADMMVSRRAAGPIVLPAPVSPDYRWHPSVDRLMASAMLHVPAKLLVGVLMTGMGNDGASSMAALHAAGGRTIAEDETTAIVWGMPRELIKLGGADLVRPLDRIAVSLTRLVTTR